MSADIALVGLHSASQLAVVVLGLLVLRALENLLLKLLKKYRESLTAVLRSHVVDVDAIVLVDIAVEHVCEIALGWVHSALEPRLEVLYTCLCHVVVC